MAIISKNWPVPAAQRSFIANFCTLPAASRAIALESCPPMSMIVLHRGSREIAPTETARISETISASGQCSLKRCLPYPVAVMPSGSHPLRLGSPESPGRTRRCLMSTS